MDPSHITKLSNTKDQLQELIVFESLRPNLETNGVFTKEMLDDIDGVGPHNKEKTAVLLKNLPKRGPSAFGNFVRSLIDSNQVAAARLLNDAIPDTGIWDGRVTQGNRRFDDSSQVYTMKARPRGVALILSNTHFENDILEHRYGGDIDEINLKRLFEHLDFDVDFHPNKNEDETMSILKNFQTDKRHMNADACIIAVLSHGSNNGFYTVDCKIIGNDAILEIFNNVNCELLRGKPKVFFLQHCRGDVPDIAIAQMNSFEFEVVTDSRPGSLLPIGPPTSLPSWSDMKICYSTSPKFISLRSPKIGTWFIACLVRIFSERAHDTTLDDMLIMLANNMLQLEVFGWKQSPEIKALGWRRKLYFNPGL